MRFLKKFQYCIILLFLAAGCFKPTLEHPRSSPSATVDRSQQASLEKTKPGEKYYQYDEEGRLVSEGYIESGQLYQVRYTYDYNGNLESRAEYVNNQLEGIYQGFNASGAL